MLINSTEYISIVENIKREITDAQYRAAVHVNADMLLLYHEIGCIINEHKSWGNKFIDNLAADNPIQEYWEPCGIQVDYSHPKIHP